MSPKKFALIALCLGAFTLTGCGSGDEVINIKNSPIVAKTGQKNMNDIKRGIMLAGSRIGWQMQPAQTGVIIATTYRRGHMAKVEITYSPKSYDIAYKDSSNLKYNGTTIHPKFNDWVEELHSHIRKALSKM